MQLSGRERRPYAILSEIVAHRTGGPEGAPPELAKVADTARQLLDQMNEIVWLVNPRRDSLHDLFLRTIPVDGYVDPGPGRGADASLLTSRERDILNGLAEGNSYQALARSLNISTDTVRFHIRNIYRKLHVHSQSEAVAKALRRGMI